MENGQMVRVSIEVISPSDVEGGPDEAKVIDTAVLSLPLEQSQISSVCGSVASRLEQLSARVVNQLKA